MSSSEIKTDVKFERFKGGSRAMTVGAVLGLAGLVATFVGMGSEGSRQDAYFSYLWAFTYWLGIGLGALILLAAFNAANGRWIVVLRRAIERMSTSVGIFILLIIPILLGMKYLFIWVDPHPAGWTAEQLKLLAHKRPYLDVTFFIVRAAIYFGVWVFLSERLARWSTDQDEAGGTMLTFKQRVLSAASLPFLALTLTFAAFDWLMSLEPLWGSTIFGVYYFAGSFLAAICVLTLVTVLARGKDLYGDLVTPQHLHNLGKLMLAFTIFWAYIAFSQFMLIWIANLPEETQWYLYRTGLGWLPDSAEASGWRQISSQASWLPVFTFLIFGHFLLPFFVLLSRKLKLKRGAMAAMAIYLLCVHAVDLYWVIMPVLHRQAPEFHWTTITAFVGVGGIAVAYTLFRARGHYTVPVKDPYLADSLRYMQPH